jgi:hypothetical protein
LCKVQEDAIIAVFQNTTSNDLILKVQRQEKVVEIWILQKFDESIINLLDTRNQSSDFMARQTGAVKCHEVMIIDDDPSIPLTRIKEITISKLAQPRTSSILLISVAISIAIILLMYARIAYTEGMMKLYYTEGMMKLYST